MTGDGRYCVRKKRLGWLDVALRSSDDEAMALVLIGESSVWYVYHSTASQSTGQSNPNECCMASAPVPSWSSVPSSTSCVGTANLPVSGTQYTERKRGAEEWI